MAWTAQDEAEYQRLEEARTIAHTDDTRQHTALAIADADADILCLQETDNMAALQAFEYGYLFRMVGNGYRQKYLIEGNDSRGIDVSVLMREETRDGQRIECVDIRSHAAVTYRDFDLHAPDLGLAITDLLEDPGPLGLRGRQRPLVELARREVGQRRRRRRFGLRRRLGRAPAARPTVATVEQLELRVVTPVHRGQAIVRHAPFWRT